MISLHVTIYNLGQGDQFQVNEATGDKPEDVTDVTAQYEVVAIQTPEGRSGFAVLKRETVPVGDAAPGQGEDCEPHLGGA